MSGPFSWRRDGGVDVRLTEPEADALVRVARELLQALREPSGEPLRRLFPPAYESDEARQEEFAVMTRLDLTARKRASARAVLEVFEPAPRKHERVHVRLDAEGAQCLLGMLNDARLVLGERLGVTEDMEPGDDPEHNLYAYLSGLEWALVEALTG